MMLDHGSFSCLQFPMEWGQPRFKLGDTVLCDGEQGIIVGASYESSISCDPEFDTYQLGWWFFVCTQTIVGNKVLKNTTGHHQDVLQPVLAVGSSGIQTQQPGITHTNTLEPLAFGVF